jgi:signal transduction histidine kinase
MLKSMRGWRRICPRVRIVTESQANRVDALQQTLQSRERELRILAHVASRIHGEEEEQRILEIAIDAILSGMDLGTAWVFLGDEADRKLRLAASRGVAPVYLDQIRTEGLGECLCPEVFWSGHRMQARNTTQCPRMPSIVEGLTVPVAHACIPLRVEGASRGVLNVAARPGEQFSEDELRFLETLGTQVCLALGRARHLQAERRAYRELKEAQARIIQSEKMAVVGTFASGLAHEVRNPLNSINLQLSILERRLARMEPAPSIELRELTGVIREEINRLDGLVGDFLQFSRTNRVQHEPRDLDVLIDEVVRLLRPEARASQVTLRRERIGEPMPQLRIDTERMKQVVMNLVRNAIEAMPEGGAVTVESGLVDGRARFVVKDEGPGLPDGLDVFQLFVTTKPKGTGLGLSIAQQVVLEHGGEITARNESGKGAAFAVSIPTGAEAAGTQERTSS